MLRASVGSFVLFAALGTACAQPVTDPSLDTDPAFAGSTGACDAAGNAIVVVADHGDIYRFSPATRSFTLLSHAQCPTGASDFVGTAAVDRSGVAWLQYSEPALSAIKHPLYPVNIADGTCGKPVDLEAAGFRGWQLTAGTMPGVFFGVAIVATPGQPGEDLKVDASLLTLDTHALKTTSVPLGPLQPFRAPFDAAIAQTSDGMLVGFFNALNQLANVKPYFVGIEPASGHMTQTPGSFPHIDTRSLSTDSPDPPSALVVWGGERWLFTGDPATRQVGRTASGSMLTRHSADGQTTDPVKREMDFLVMGAGVVACEGGPPLR